MDICTWAYVKLQVAHAPGMPGTFSSPPRVSDPDMHRGTCVTHVPWCIPGSLVRGFLWSRWWGKRFWHSRRICNPQFCVSGKRPMPSCNQCHYSKLKYFLITHTPEENGASIKRCNCEMYRGITFIDTDLQWHCLWVNGARPCWWEVNIGSGASCNKPLPEPLLTEDLDTIWPH